MTLSCRAVRRTRPGHNPLRRPSRALAGDRGARVLMMILGTFAAGLSGLGCDRASALDTPEGEALCGRITLGSAYRSGFSPRVQMRLRFDASKIDSSDSPGTLSTYDSGVEDDTAARLLNEAPLRPIRPLTHDPLSQLDFGQGRDLNMIYAATPADPTHEAVLAVISLRNDDQVEVRIIRPGIDGTEDEPPPPARQPLFGMFLLNRRTGDCF